MKRYNHSNTTYRGRGYYPAITPRQNGQITFNKALEIELGLRADDKVEILEGRDQGKVKWYIHVSEAEDAFVIRREKASPAGFKRRKQLYFQNRFLSNKLRKLAPEGKPVKLLIGSEPIDKDGMELYEIEY